MSWLEPDDPRWSALLAQFEHDVHHLPRYVALEGERLAGQGVALLARSSSGVALLPLVLRPVPGFGVDATSPYGYPAPLCSGVAEPLIGALMASLRERGVIAAFVRGHPLLASPRAALAEHGEVVEQGETVWIDLRASAAEQWAGHRATHRNLIHRLRREAFVVELDFACTGLDEFFDVYAATMQRVGADWASFGRAWIEGLVGALGGQVFLARVSLAGRLAAAAMFTRCGGIVQYHLSGTADEFQAASPSRLLIDEVRRWASAEGLRALHLGGGVGSRDDALLRFKQGFSPRRGRHWSFRAVLNSEVYRSASGGESSPQSDFFPAYRRPKS
ncbi:GNAT family N-acetyltransferase [Nannocystaceae bacterium ST9]